MENLKTSEKEKAKAKAAKAGNKASGKDRCSRGIKEGSMVKGLFDRYFEFLTKCFAKVYTKNICQKNEMSQEEAEDRSCSVE